MKEIVIHVAIDNNLVEIQVHSSYKRRIHTQSSGAISHSSIHCAEDSNK